MATQALYRTWRPATFSDVVGQDAIVTTLKNQVSSGRVAHAYLFCGSRGTGKTSSAKIFARAVNCVSPKDGDPCGVCAACRALEAENSLDIVEIDAASNNGVDEIRDLREKVKYPPQHGRYRVYIIDEVHMLSTGAFNALLKTLEEPPGHALFILATTEPRRLPATVLSRCQRYDFRRIPLRDIIGRLRKIAEGEHADVSPDALALIAQAAEGGMRDAISLMDMCISFGGGSADLGLVREVLGAADRGFLFRFADHLLDGDAARAVMDIDTLIRAGQEPHVFSRDVSQHLRGLMLAQTCAEALAGLLETTEEDAALMIGQAERVTRARLLFMLDLFLNAESDMKWSGQPRVVLELAAVRACLPEESLRLEALASRMELVEKRLERGEANRGEAKAAPADMPLKGMEAPSAAYAAPDTSAIIKEEIQTAPAVSDEKKEAASAPPLEKSVWDKALRLIKKEPYLYAPVTKGRFAGIENGTARILYPKEGEIYLNMIRQAGRQEKIEAMLTEAAGRPMTLTLEVESESKAATPRQKSLMQSVFDTFGREHVEVVDDPTA
ncbi:MAG: DNA polymerase III subunit gamma/tau [Firmicutes bacterium]|nr:DNA polymerase III subunit gamma/tau [Bacillota bacterium]